MANSLVATSSKKYVFKLPRCIFENSIVIGGISKYDKQVMYFMYCLLWMDGMVKGVEWLCACMHAVMIVTTFETCDMNYIYNCLNETVGDIVR